jgi:hypothetical protein
MLGKQRIYLRSLQVVKEHSVEPAGVRCFPVRTGLHQFGVGVFSQYQCAVSFGFMYVLLRSFWTDLKR